MNVASRIGRSSWIILLHRFLRASSVSGFIAQRLRLSWGRYTVAEIALWVFATIGPSFVQAAPLCWTHDGTRLAYVVCDGGLVPLESPPAGPVNGDRRPVGDGSAASLAVEASPFLLPAMRLFRGGDLLRGPTWRLRTCAADGSNDQLVHASQKPLGGVAWSPGGDALAVLVLDPPPKRDPAAAPTSAVAPAAATSSDEGGWELLVFRAPGAPSAAVGGRWEGNRRMSSAARAAEWSRTELAWHPREERIVAGLPGESALVERREGAWAVANLLPGMAMPAWSPAGRRFACFRREPDGSWRLVFGDDPVRPSNATALVTQRLMAAPIWETDDSLLALQAVAERPREPSWQLRLTFLRCEDPQTDVPVCTLREQSGFPLGGPVRVESSGGFAPTLERAWFTPLSGKRTTLVHVRQSGFSHRVAKVVRGEGPEPWHPLDPLLPLESMRSAPDRPRTAGLFGGAAPGEPTVCFLTNLSSTGLIFPEVDAAGRLGRAAVFARVCRRLLERPIEAALADRFTEKPPPFRLVGLPSGFGWNPSELARDPALARSAARIQDLAERGTAALDGLDLAALPSDARRIEALELKLLFARLLDDPRFPEFATARLELARSEPERIEGAVLHAMWTALRGRSREALAALDLLRPPLRRWADPSHTPSARAWAADLLLLLDRWPQAF